MCTRYISPDTAAIERHWHVGRNDAWRGAELFPRAPGPFIRAERDAVGPGRELVMGQWGLIPWFAKEAKLGFSTVNARFEDITSKPSYKDRGATASAASSRRGPSTNRTGRPVATCGGASREQTVLPGVSQASGTLGMARAGWLDRFPDLKIILSHGGGFVPYAAERTARICSPDGGTEGGIARLRRFYFDTALSSSLICNAIVARFC